MLPQIYQGIKKTGYNCVDIYKHTENFIVDEEDGGVQAPRTHGKWVESPSYYDPGFSLQKTEGKIRRYDVRVKCNPQETDKNEFQSNSLGMFFNIKEEMLGIGSNITFFTKSDGKVEVSDQ